MAAQHWEARDSRGSALGPARQGQRRSEQRIAQILSDVTAPSGRLSWTGRGDTEEYSRSTQRPWQQFLPQSMLAQEMASEGSHAAAGSLMGISRTAMESKRATDLAIRKMELESMMRQVKEMEQRVADERRARTVGAAAPTASHKHASLPGNDTSEAVEFDKLIRNGVQKIRDVGESEAPYQSLRNYYARSNSVLAERVPGQSSSNGMNGKPSSETAAPNSFRRNTSEGLPAPVPSLAERNLTRAMEEVAKHQSFLTGKFNGANEAHVTVSETNGGRGPQQGTDQYGVPLSKGVVKEPQNGVEPSSRELGLLRVKLDKEMAQRIAMQETGNTLQVELMRSHAQINQLTQELAESEKKRQAVESRTSDKMSKAEAAQKALRTELDKLKETASAAHNLHLESEGKKVKYLQSELEKLEKELHRERGVREMAERRATELDSQLSRMNIMLGRSEQGYEESLQSRDYLQKECNRLKDQLSEERKARQTDESKKIAECARTVKELETKLEDEAAEKQVQMERMERRARETIREKDREIELKKAEVSGLRESLKEQSTMIAILKRRVEEHGHALKGPNALKAPSAPTTSTISSTTVSSMINSNLEANVAKLTSEIAELRKRASNSERALREAEARVTEWRGKAEQQGKLLAELQSKEQQPQASSWKSNEGRKGSVSSPHWRPEEDRSQNEADFQRLGEQHRREVERLESEISRLKHDLEMYRVTHDAQSETEKASTQGRMVSLDAELRSKDARLSSMQKEFEGKVATLEDTVLQTNSLVKRKEQEVASLRQQLQASETVVAEQRGQLAAMQTSGTIEQESFKARVDASAGEMASLQWQLKEREAEVREAATKLEELERNSRESIATRDTLLNDLRVKVVKQDEQIAGLEANANNAQRLMAEKKCEVAELEGQLSAGRRLVADREEKLEQMSAELAASQRAASSTAALLSGEKSSLEERMASTVAKYEEQVNTLEQEARSREKSWRGKLESAQDALESAQAEIGKRDEELGQLGIQLHSSEEHVKELEGQMADTAANAGALQETLQAAVSKSTAQVAEGRNEVGRLEARVRELEGEVTEKATHVAKLQREMESISGQLAEAKGDLQARMAELSTKEAELTQTAESAASMQEEIRLMSEKLSGLEGEVAAGEESRGSVQAKLEEQEGKCEALLKTVAEREAELTEANDKAAQLQQQVEELTNTLEQREFELSGAEQELDSVSAEAQAERAMLEEELAEAQGVAEDWRQRVQQLEETMQDLKHELSEARARSAASRETVLEHEASKLRAELKQKSEQLEALHVDMESWSLEREDHQRVVSELEAELDAGRIERSQLESELQEQCDNAASVREAGAVEEEMEAMRLENQEAREQVLFLEAELASAQEEVQRLTEDAGAGRAAAGNSGSAAEATPSYSQSVYVNDAFAEDNAEIEQLQAELFAKQAELEELRQREPAPPPPSLTPSRPSSRLSHVRVATPGGHEELLDDGQSPHSWLLGGNMLSTSLTQPFSSIRRG